MWCCSQQPPGSLKDVQDLLEVKSTVTSGIRKRAAFSAASVFSECKQTSAGGAWLYCQGMCRELRENHNLFCESAQGAGKESSGLVAGTVF